MSTGKVLAPVALFAYKRADHLRRTLDSLRANPLAGETDLHVYCDGPRSVLDQPGVTAVRDLVNEINGFRSVRCVARECNWGLANSIIAGVTELLANHGRVIVLEDDMETSPWFLDYMNDMLETYADAREVASIHAYALPADDLPDYYFMRGADCWGWATWQDRWRLFEADSMQLVHRLRTQGQLTDFNRYGSRPLWLLTKQALGSIDSWYIRWHAATFLAGKFTLHPGKSFVRNIGTDGTGTHGDAMTTFDARMIGQYRRPALLPVAERAEVIDQVNAWYRRTARERLRSFAKFTLSYFNYLRLQWR